MYRWLPFWILIAPVVLLVLDWLRMPKRGHRDASR